MYIWHKTTHLLCWATYVTMYVIKQVTYIATCYYVTYYAVCILKANGFKI